MRTIELTLLLLAGCFQIAGAQSFDGIYTLPTSRGAITLTLQQNGPGNVTGTLVGDDGVAFQLQGVTQQGVINGSLANATGPVAAVEGGLAGDRISFHLIPLDGNGQPNYASAQEFVMDRQGQVPSDEWSRPSAPPASSPLGVMAAPPSSGSSSLAGTYAGTIDGTPASLVLQQNGASLTGVIDAGGYGYTLTGTAQGESGRGTLADPQAGSAMEFELAAQGSALTLTILATDPYSGQMQRIPFSFHRGGAAPAGPFQGAPAVGREGNVERDPALVGAWSHSDTYMSGDFSSTTRLSLHVNPDGTYLYGNGSVSIGGANEMGSYGGQSGGGDVTRGQWRTEGNIIYIMEAGSAQWAPYARYYVEGGQMVFTFGDGSKQLWSRR